MTKFAKLLKDSDMTYSRLSRRLGVSREAVSAWARGRNIPNAQRVSEIARHLGVTVDEVVKCFMSTDFK